MVFPVGMVKTSRLSRDFHKTFKPERQYIHALLKFAAAGKKGDIQKIAFETGIPTGASSGKVSPTIDYCRAMGLVRITPSSLQKTKEVELTDFGRIVFLEDPFLKCPVTQWIAHLNLCSPNTGADVWYQTFFPGSLVLGNSFTREQLESYLGMVYGTSKTGFVGPMIGMYSDEASFKSCGAIIEKDNGLKRIPAPVRQEYAFGYGAWLLQIINEHFSGFNQISVVELDKVAGWRTIPWWSLGDSLDVLTLLESKGIICVERHMQPWLIQQNKDITEIWQDLYIDVI